MTTWVNPSECRGFLERREQARQAALDQRFAQARRDFQAMTSFIVAKYRPKRLYQWGSLLHRRRFWDHSDLDLAVEGIVDPETFFAMCGDADRMTSFPLDLVALEQVEPEFRELILSGGRLIYEQ